jgi:hypothetical protein
LEGEADLACRFFRGIWFQEDVDLRLRYEAEHSHKRPSEDAGLLAGKLRNSGAPRLELLRQRTVAVKWVIETGGKQSRSLFTPNGVTQSHFLKGEKQTSSGLDFDRPDSYILPLSNPD